MQLSGDWVGEATLTPADYLPLSGKLSPLARVAADAMAASGCAAAFICRAVDGGLEVIAQANGGIFAATAPCMIGTSRTTPLIQPIGRGLHLAGSLGFTGPDAELVTFAAYARVPGDDAAVLILADDERRTPLNPAQTYLLLSQASHLATVFEVERLREIVDGAAVANQRGQIERLRLLESVAVHARDSIIITEADPVNLPGPRILYCNEAFTKATGYTAAEALGQTPRILQGEGTDPASRAKLREALENWQSIEIELINYRKDGTPFWVELSIVPVADENGWFTHWVSVQRDVTERKEAEELATRMRIAEIENQLLASEIQERKRVEAKLLYTAYHDSLTRLRNRAFFMERLTAALDRSQRGEQGPCSVLFLDLDRFKIVNDSLGHNAGDTLLQDIAQRLKGCIRPQDTLARIGGDEFAVLIEDATDLSLPVRIAECIIGSLRMPVYLGRQSIFPSCSIGIVQSVDPLAVPENLMRDADIAMYEAKRTGFGDYAIFDASMHDNAVALLVLQTDLRQALDRSEFVLAYQPIVDPATGGVCSFEALIRWNHPERGLVLPTDFIPIAEQIGLIRQIDRWVMREACRQLKIWQTQFARPDLRMSVNTSAAEFADTGFMADLSSVLDQNGLDPDSLELEITEGIFLNPSPAIAETIARVRDAGVRIALDDFGTGYSSLSYINRYPIDRIKIDKSFIDGLCNDPRTSAIVELIVTLGATLDVSITAEGVETEDQVTALTKIGCHFIQGFYYARPLSPEDATRMIG